MAGWSWDETLYGGAAAYYVTGRMPYPPQVVDVLRGALGLDGRGRLLDVGCGPGSLTLLLAPLFEQAVGIDADRDMIEVATGGSGVAHAEFRQLRAEQLPAGLGRFRVVTFAQSFHWMQRLLVAGLVRQMLEPGGAVVIVGATTHQGVPGEDPLPHPRPPQEDIEALLRRWLGPVRRAGQGTLPEGPPAREDDVLREAGFSGPERIQVGDAVLRRTEDEVVAAVFSLSYAAPHLFGARLAQFEAQLRAVLRARSPGAVFSERRGEITLRVYRPRGRGHRTQAAVGSR